MQYCICRTTGASFESCIKVLEHDVNELVKQGWMPHGDMKVIKPYGDYQMAQPMVRETSSAISYDAMMEKLKTGSDYGLTTVR